MTSNTIAQVLGMNELLNRTNNVQILPPNPEESLSQANNDFDFTRSNLINIINSTKEALDNIHALSLSSQDAEYYDTLAKLTKTYVEANKELLALQKSIRDINNTTSGHTPSKVQNNLIITTQDLLKMIKDNN